jgi:hypothetical protein
LLHAISRSAASYLLPTLRLQVAEPYMAHILAHNLAQRLRPAQALSQ